MDFKDPKKIYNKLKNICIKIGQRVVYFIFQKLLNYPKINKPNRYDKLAMQIFAEIQYFCNDFGPQ